MYKNTLNEPIYKHLIIFISGLNHLNISKKININLNIPFLMLTTPISSDILSYFFATSSYADVLIEFVRFGKNFP